MRALPTLLVVLGVVVAGALGLRVLQNQRAAPAASAPPDPQGGGVPQGHVYTGCTDEPTDVNPFTTSDPVAQRLVLGHTHDGLLAVDRATGELQPALAERFELDADGGGCTFTLRAGVRFADGSDVTLDDVLFGWELARAGHLAMGHAHDAFARVGAVERLDDRRFRVAFRDRHYAVLRVVGEAWLVAQKRFFVARVAARCAPEPPPPVDSAAFAVWLDQIDTECGPGTGPYRLDNDPAGTANWRPRQDLLLVRNEHCWRRVAAPGTWNFAGIRLLVRDPAGAQHALLRDEIDWFTGLTAEALVAAHPDLEQHYRQLRYDHPSLGVYRAVWNCRTGPCRDARVRRALAMLFDVEGLLGMAGSGASRAFAHAKPGSVGYPTGLEPLPHDPAAARALLREAGYDPAQGKPLALTVIAFQGTPMLERICDVLAHGAGSAGIELDLRRRAPAAFVQEKQSTAWDGLLGLQSFRGWADPYDLLHSEGVDNDGGFHDADVDRLATAARTEHDPTARAALWREMHTIVWREQPAALLLHPQVSLLLSRRVEGAFVGREGIVLERAFVAPARQRH